MATKDLAQFTTNALAAPPRSRSWLPFPGWYSAEHCAKAESVLARVRSGEDTPDLCGEVLDFLYTYSHHSSELGEVVGVICAVSEPGVCGTALRIGLTSGKMLSPLAKVWSRAQILWLVQRADPHTLMDEAEERAVFNALPDPVTAWRGGREGPSLRQPAAGLSWTLSIEKARWFADRWSGSPRRGQVVQAQFPRDAVYAYLNGLKEQELIVNWRRARQLIAV